tara:strand:+ start:229 stop:507 length:279 start_codon:yes stop_codon:yes gene_type:complete
MKIVSAFKMKGFSGFGNSPVKAADEALLEASKMGSDESAETIANIDVMRYARVREKDNSNNNKNTKKKDYKKSLKYRLSGKAGRAKMDKKNN